MRRPTYTTVIHTARLSLGLSMNEYCIADSIAKLSNSAEFPWCKLKRETLGKFIGISERSTIDIVNTLVKKGLIEIDHVTRKARATQKWIDTVVFSLDSEQGEESSPHESGVKKVHPAGEAASSRSIYNNNNSKKTLSEFSHSEDQQSTESPLEEGRVLVEVDNDGNESNPSRARPKAKKKEPDAFTQFVNSFQDMCVKKGLPRPIVAGWMRKNILKDFRESGLTQRHADIMMEDWFSVDRKDEDMINMSFAFSARNLNDYKARNNLK